MLQRARIVREAIAPAELDLDELWAFITAYVSRSRETFEAALRGYERVSLWRREGKLVGFAANKAVTVEIQGQPATALYSGWAILAPEVRGRNLLQAEGARCFARCKLQHPLRPTYWVFGASTYKSYLLLPRNFKTYFPRRERPWGGRELAVRDAVMAKLEDPHWDRLAGVIHRFGVSRYREGVVQDDPRVLDHPDVAFYAGANPGQAEGDTLLVVVPLTARNWLALAGHALRRAGLLSWARPPHMAPTLAAHPQHPG